MADLKTSKWNMQQLLNAGRLQEALRLGQRLCAAYPQDTDVWYLKGLAEARLNELQAASQSFEHVLQRAPNDAITHYNLARVRRLQGRVHDAIAGYRTALRLRPNIAEAHNNLGELLRQIGDVDTALAHYRQALKLRPNYSGAYSNMLFALSYHLLSTPAELLAAHREWDRQFGEAGRAGRFTHVPPTPDDGRGQDRQTRGQRRSGKVPASPAD